MSNQYLYVYIYLKYNSILIKTDSTLMIATVETMNDFDDVEGLLNLMRGNGTIYARGLKVANKGRAIIDSGCSRIMSNNYDDFIPQTMISIQNEYVYLGDDTPIPIKGKGEIDLNLGGHKFRIEGVLWVPDLVDSLISISHLVKNTNDYVVFANDKVYLYLQKENKTIKFGQRMGNLYYLDVNEGEIEKEFRQDVIERCKAFNSKASKRIPYLRWHSRLGHIGMDKVVECLKYWGIPYNFKKDPTDCTTCQIVNFRKRTTESEGTVPTDPLHTLCEDMFELPVLTRDRERYCVFIYDKYSRYAWALFLRTKDEFTREFINFVKVIEVELKSHVVEFQGDMGELRTMDLTTFRMNHEPAPIQLKMSPADTQALNGATERPLGVYRARAYCMLAVAGLDGSWFRYAMEYACLMGGILVNTRGGKSPYELLTNKDLTVSEVRSFTRTFGCLAAVFVPKLKRRTRCAPGHKAEPGIFLGWVDYKARIAHVYKYRTRAVHREFQIRLLESILPGPILKTTFLNPFTDLNWSNEDRPLTGGQAEVDNDDNDSEDSQSVSEISSHESIPENDWYEGEILEDVDVSLTRG